MKTPGAVVLTTVLILTMMTPALSLSPVALRTPRSSSLSLTTEGPILSEAALAAADVDIRVNCGGPAYTDTQGQLWQADKPYTAGSWGYTGGTTYSDTSLDIVDTEDDTLYQYQRFSPGAYQFDVPNDVYEVELRFAEIYRTYETRSFNVAIEGTTLLTNFGFIRYAGFRRALNTTFQVRVTDNQLRIAFSGTLPAVNAIRVTSLAGSPPRNQIRLNAGYFDYRDGAGNVWVADQPYLQGTRGYQGTQSNTFKTTTTIGGTSDQTLFQTNRYGMTGYAFDMENGAYRVHLLFAELYVSVNSPGSRVFDVWAEGVKVIPDMDVFRVAGNKYIAITQTFDINVLDQQLNITFTNKTANPAIINAIAILPLDSSPPGPWTNFQPTTWQTTLMPSASVQIRDDQSGLDVSSAQYAYSTNGGSTYSPWQAASVTGSNGTTATQTVSVPSIPFNQDSATQNKVKFRIRDMSGNESTSPEYAVQIDTTPPASAVTSPAPGALVGGPTVTIQGTATDAASGVQGVEVSTDGGVSWGAASGTTSWTYNWPVPGDGMYTIRSRARDNVGLVETPGAGITVTVDSVPPVTFIRTPVNGQIITSSTYLITGTAFDATSGIRRVEVSVDGGTSWITATGATAWSYPWTPAGQGPFTIRARAVDNAGNVDTPGTGVSVIVDRQPPTTTIVDPTPDRILRGTEYTISGTASDGANGSGLSRVEVSTDGVAWQLASGLETWHYVWAPLPTDGSYTLRSRAWDQAGNVQSPPTTVSVMVDNTPPVSVHSLSGTMGNNDWYVSPATLTLMASDAASGVRAVYYRVDGGVWLTYTAPVPIAVNGSHTVNYYAVDNAGNTEPSHSIAIKVDTVAPQTSHFLSGSIGGGGWFRSAVVFSLVSTDAASGVQGVFYSVDGGPWTAYSGAVTVATEGAHTLTYYAIDNAGNSETVRSAAFRVDTQPPVAVITSPTAGQAISGTFTIWGTASDSTGSGVSGVEVSIDGGEWANAIGTSTWSYAWTAPGPGTYNIRARAKDVAGNVQTPDSGIYVTVDTTRPTSSIISPLSGQILAQRNVVVQGTSSDTFSGVALVEVSTNGGLSWLPAVLGDEGAWSFNWTVPNDGIYNLRSRATDRAGNMEIPGSGISVQVDSIAPLSVIGNPVTGTLLRASFYQITGTATDVGSGLKRVEVSIDGGAWDLATGTSAWSYVWSPIGQDGPHTIRSRATDNAGNVESPGQTVMVTVDNTKPTSTIRTPVRGEVVTTPALLIAGTSADNIAGVQRVDVAIQRGLDGYFWDGGDWTPDETWLATSGAVTDWSYLWDGVPMVGMAIIRSRATDNVGNVESPGPGVLVSIRRGYAVFLPIAIGDFSP